MTAPPTPRCSDAARLRDDPLFATAPPATRLLLVEVPGPWGRTAISDSRLDRYAGGRLAELAVAAGARVLLVRRPGRHVLPPAGVPKAWALADLRPGREHVRWGTWGVEHDLLDLDLDAELIREPAGPQRVALVCTHGRHDVCCAVRGRPVAAALAEGAPGWDVWECSHVGGDRFAANVLLVPSGELLGSLDEVSAVTALAAFDEGRLDLVHHRGRYGRPPVEQAAEHHLRVALGDDRRGAVRVLRITGDGPEWTVELGHADRRLLVTVVARWSPPARLTCSSAGPDRVRRLDLVSIEDAVAESARAHAEP